MAATQQSSPAVSYKEKLLQPSEQDELSHPDQAPLPKLPPTKDEGSPSMTINVPAPAPAGEEEAATTGLNTNAASSRNTSTSKASSEGKPWSPKGNTQSAIDARFHFARSVSGKKGVPKADYVAPVMREGSASCAVQPQNVDDHPSDDDVPPPTAKQSQTKATPAADASSGSIQEQAPVNITDAAGAKIAGTELSDMEQEVMADPSTADLVAAATESTDAPATTPLPAANAVIVDTDDSSDVTSMQADVSGVAAGAFASGPTAAAAAAGGGSGEAAASGEGEGSAAVDESAGESVDKSAHNVGLGDVLGMPIMVRRIITAPSDAAAVMNAGAEDADRNAPGKAHGMAVTPRSGDGNRTPRCSTDSSSSAAAAAAADGELAEGSGGDARMFTASDFAAAGLADLTAEADAAGPAGGGAGSGNASSDEDAAAAVAAPDEAAGASAGGDAAGPAAESYGHLLQAPAAAGDAAAVPAPSTPEEQAQGELASGDTKGSAGSDSGSSSGVVQQVVGAVKSAAGAVTGDTRHDSAAAAAGSGKEGGSGIGGAVSAVVEAGKSAVDSATAAASAAVNKEDDAAASAAADEEGGSSSGHGGGLSGAVGAVMSGLKDVLLGPDVPVEAVMTAVGEGVDESAEAGDSDGGALGQEMERSANEEGQPGSFAVL